MKRDTGSGYFTRKLKKEAAARVKALRAAVGEARRTGALAVRAAMGDCRAAKERAKGRVKAAKQELNEAREQRRQAKTSCAVGVAEGRSRRAQLLAQAAYERDLELNAQARDRARAKALRAGRDDAQRRDPNAGRRRAAEKRSEAVDFAVQNVPDELLDLWKVEGPRFKGNPHQRVERFLEWVEENPDARYELAAKNSARLDRELERELERMHRENAEASAEPEPATSVEKKSARRRKADRAAEARQQKDAARAAAAEEERARVEAEQRAVEAELERLRAEAERKKPAALRTIALFSAQRGTAAPEALLTLTSPKGPGTKKTRVEMTDDEREAWDRAAPGRHPQMFQALPF